MTMAEDLGINAVLALGNLEGSFDRTKNSAEELTNVKYDTVSEALQGLGRTIETGLVSKIGDALLPILEKLTPIIDNVVTKIGAWIEENPTLVSTLAIIAGTLGTLLTVLGPVITTIGMATVAFSSMPAVISVVGTALSALMSPIGLVIAGAVALAIAIASNWDKIKEATNNLLTTCKGYFDNISEFFKNLWNSCVEIYNSVIVPLFNNIFNSIANAWNSIGKPVFDGIVNIFRNVWSVAQSIFTNISNLFNSVISTISSVWNGIGSPIFNAIINIIRNVSSVVGPAFSTFKNAIVNAMNAVLSPIQWVIDKLSTLLGWISDVGSKVGNFISNLNPFKNLFGRETSYDVNYNDVSPALSGHYYQPNTIKSRSIEGLTNVVGRINTQNTTKANEQAQQIDFNQLKDTIAQSIAEGLKGIILQANVNSYLDGEQLANSLEIAQGRNLNLYGRFNG